jgi:ABC-type polar amino acid transport system ATPase subunit
MLAITGLVKRRGETEVLQGVDLQLQRGQVGVLVGPSGAGKSTLLRCVNGLDPFDAGSVRVAHVTLNAADSESVRRQRLSELRRHVGIVFQQFHLFPHLTVLGNVIEAPRFVLGQTRSAAATTGLALLDRMGLAAFANRYPAQLSGGQQQRVAIARALAMQPDVILFDEPTSALDPAMAAEVLSVINDLSDQGQTMLVVTHAIGFARRVADEVVVMAAGQIVEQGPPDKVFGDPRHESTRQLIKESELS